MLDSNVTLTAQWTAINYTITYNKNGGTLAGIHNGDYTIEQTITLPNATHMTKAGYTFEGWYTTETLDAGTKVTKIQTGSTGNKVFWANWTINGYSINYNLDGGTNPDDAPTSYRITDTPVTLPTPTKTGYTFGGWYFNSVYSGSVQTTIPEN